MIVRNLRPGENWPESLPMGFEGDALDTNWCWVVEHNGVVVAGLLTCFMHRVIFLMRIASGPGAPKMALYALLRDSLRAARARGCTGYITLTDPSDRACVKLERLIKAAGGVEWPRPCIMHIGLLSQTRKL
jgi:hypothetical protein